jgi:hypothetical protein
MVQSIASAEVDSWKLLGRKILGIGAYMHFLITIYLLSVRVI